MYLTKCNKYFLVAKYTAEGGK